MKKPDEKLRFYIDYKIFNIFIIFNRNALSLIKKILIKFYAIKIYNKFDIIIVFNEIRVKKNHEKKIVFLIKYNFYKYIIIFFGLYNASTIFQIFINDILKEYLNIFYTIYFDDILIYNNIKKKHIYYIDKILKKL